MAFSEQNTLEVIGSRLREARTQSRTSQIHAAELIGVSHRAYHAYEKGQRGIPIAALLRFASIFQVEPSWLLLGTETVRISHDFEAVRYIVTTVDQLIEAGDMPVSSEQRGKIVAVSYKRHLETGDVSVDGIQDMISILST